MAVAPACLRALVFGLILKSAGSRMVSDGVGHVRPCTPEEYGRFCMSAAFGSLVGQKLQCSHTWKKKIPSPFHCDEARESTHVFGYASRLNRKLTCTGSTTDYRIAVIVEVLERGIVHPVLLDELELSQ